MYSFVMLLIGMPQPVQDSALSLSELSDGEHYYSEPSSTELTHNAYLFLQKWGRIVVGVDTLSSSRTACFKGFVEGNAIVDATRVLPPYTPDAEWTYQPGEMLDLSGYEIRMDAIAEADRAALNVCLDVFAR